MVSTALKALKQVARRPDENNYGAQAHVEGPGLRGF